MQIRRFRLKSLMILVLVLALIMGAVDNLARLDPRDFDEIPLRVYLLMPFLILVALKLGLVIGARSRRSKPETPPEV